MKKIYEVLIRHEVDDIETKRVVEGCHSWDRVYFEKRSSAVKFMAEQIEKMAETSFFGEALMSSGDYELVSERRGGIFFRYEGYHQKYKETYIFDLSERELR